MLRHVKTLKHRATETHVCTLLHLHWLCEHMKFQYQQQQQQQWQQAGAIGARVGFGWHSCMSLRYVPHAYCCFDWWCYQMSSMPKRVVMPSPPARVTQVRAPRRRSSGLAQGAQRAGPCPAAPVEQQTKSITLLDVCVILAQGPC